MPSNHTKTLGVPELVPFRMTQNIIDGMGPLGTEGTFTTAAETTLSTLKENIDALLTILSAVVGDPLYRWNLVDQHAQQENDDEGYSRGEYESEQDAPSAGHNENDLAESALTRIQEKLKGYEDGTSGEQQTVESQVQFLLNAAQDPNNLSCIYPGWQPYL